MRFCSGGGDAKFCLGRYEKDDQTLLFAISPAKESDEGCEKQLKKNAALYQSYLLIDKINNSYAENLKKSTLSKYISAITDVSPFQARP